MSDLAQGPGWWLASDGKWYPPEQAPATVSEGTTPGVEPDSPPIAIGIRPAAGPSLLDLPGQHPGQRVSFTSWKTGMQTPEAERPSRFAIPNATPLPGAGATPPPASTSGLAGFDDNQYSARSTGFMPTPSKKHGRLALPLVILIILIIGGAVGGTIYFVLHPSPHHSAEAIGLDFYKQISNSNWAAATIDVEPTQQVTASSMGSNSEVEGLAKELNTQNLSALSQSLSDGQTSVVIQGCNISFSCGSVGSPIPVVEIGGKWYVNYQTWLAGLTPKS